PFVGLLAAHPTFVIAGERVGAERRPMTGSAKQSNLGVVAALLAMTGLALRRRHLLRREAAVEGLALGGHVDQKLWRGEARAVFGLELMAELDEFLRAHKIDVGQRTTGKRRKAKPEDRADIGLAHIGDDMILHGARGFHR